MRKTHPTCLWTLPSLKPQLELYREPELKIIWRAFPLHPDIPEEGGLIEELFGNNLPLTTEKMQQLENKALYPGLPLAKRTTISDRRLSWLPR